MAGCGNIQESTVSRHSGTDSCATMWSFFDRDFRASGWQSLFSYVGVVSAWLLDTPHVVIDFSLSRVPPMM